MNLPQVIISKYHLRNLVLVTKEGLVESQRVDGVTSTPEVKEEEAVRAKRLTARRN
jgi:hypothetical protein